MPTEAEKCLWEMLRNKNLGKKFRRQHIIGGFIVDFVCMEDQLVIEVDGPYHENHQQEIEDKLREDILKENGYQILRFTNEEVINNPDAVIEQIKKHMSARSESSPSGGVEGAPQFIKWYDREAHTHFDVCADDHCQRYQGVHRKITTQVHEAIRATRGIVLSYEGEVCDARFSKCCGGITELYESCWDDTPHPYLSVVRDPFCNTNDPKILSEVLNHYDQGTDFYRWTVEYTQKELSELVRRRSGFDYGDIIDLIPIERGPSGRIVRLQIVGTKATRIIGKELEIRRTLSETHLYSSAFEVEKKGGLPNPSQGGASDNAMPESSPSGGVEGASFILHGSGWGHGVGLCQIGAAVMGAQGYKFDEILHHYYPEARLTEWYIDTNNLQCPSKVTVST
ncbi:MAG: SpoIID/LytB domain-containing protein [Bacteroidaceae bacterium]|nr:SpoIID/LytB domain-containing protein [Bacteroidaceae bacterium]